MEVNYEEIHGLMRTLCTLFILVMLVMLILVGCSEIEETEISDEPVQKVPDQELYDATIRFDSDGTPRLKLKSAKIFRYEAMGLVEMEGGVEADFFRNGKHSAVLNSDRLTILEQKDILTAMGNVVIKSDSGMTLRSEHLHYNSEIERVETDSFVTMISPHDSLSGYGFSSTPDLQEWTIKKPSGTTWRRPERSEKSAK